MVIIQTRTRDNMFISVQNNSAAIAAQEPSEMFPMGRQALPLPEGITETEYDGTVEDVFFLLTGKTRPAPEEFTNKVWPIPPAAESV